MGHFVRRRADSCRQPASLTVSLLACLFVLGLAACGGGGGGSGTYTVGGSVSGLDGTLVLQNNSADDLTLTANGPFVFATGLPDGGAYAVSIEDEPDQQVCSVSSGSGTIAAANVTDVSVSCGDVNVTARGAAQKGPFENGAEVTISEVNGSLEATGTVFTTETINNLGEFRTTSQIDAPFVDVVTNGFFFDEIRDQTSSASIRLRTLSEYTEGETINVNILTNLASRRVERLLNSGAQTTFDGALVQAQSEVLGMFGIETSGIPDFDTLDIAGTGPGNAILIAVSALLMQAAITESPTAPEGILQTLIANIGSDFEANGDITDQEIIDQIVAAGIALDVDAVRANLENKYNIEGEPITAADFEDFVDRDGDGVLPIDGDDDEPDAFTLTAVTGVYPSTVQTSEAVTITGITGNVRVSLTGGVLLWNDADDEPDLGFVAQTVPSSGITVLVAQENDQLQVRLTVPQNGFGTTYTATLAIGDTAHDYDVSTCTEIVCYANGIFVATAANGGDDDNPGSMAAPMLTLQAAIDRAAEIALQVEALESGTGVNPAVHVSEGTYTITTPIVMADGVSVFGGYNSDYSDRITPFPEGESTFGGYPTQIVNTTSTPGSESTPNTAVDGGTAVGNATAFDGFVIFGASNVSNSGVRILNSSPTISNNVIVGGGSGQSNGIFINESSGTTNPIISANYVFSDTGAAETGTAIYMLDGSASITDNIKLNASADGFDAKSIYIEHCTSVTISGNEVTDADPTGANTGTGFEIRGGCTATVDSNTIGGIDAGNGGSTIGILIADATVTVTNNDIEGGGNADNTAGSSAAVEISLTSGSHTVKIGTNGSDGNIINTARLGTANASAYGIRINTVSSGTASITGNTIGSGASVTNGVTAQNSAYGIYLSQADGVTIANNTIQGVVGGMAAFGIYNASSDDTTISGNTIHGGDTTSGATSANSQGIFASGSLDLTISNNQIDGGDASDIARGIYVNNNGISTANTFTISGNTIFAGEASLDTNTETSGIEISDFFNTAFNITNNTIIGGSTTNSGGGPTYGIRMLSAGMTTISGNTIYGGTAGNAKNSTGIVAGDGAGVSIRNNTIHGGDTNGNAKGISVDVSADIDNNTIAGGGSEGTKYGIYLPMFMGSPVVVIRNNVIFAATTCIYESDADSDPTTVDNNVLDCTEFYFDENSTALDEICSGTGNFGTGGSCSTTLTSPSANDNTNTIPTLEEDSYFNQVTLSFTGGTQSFTLNDQLVTGADSGATGTLTDKTGTTSSGTLTLASVKGIFLPGENITGAIDGDAFLGGAPTFNHIWQLDDAECLNSPFFDIGLDLESAAGFTDDKEGTTRKTSGGWTPGAYEMESDPGDCG